MFFSHKPQVQVEVSTYAVMEGPPPPPPQEINISKKKKYIYI